MTKTHATLAAIAFASLVGAGSAFAFAAGDTVGTNEADIRTALEAQGYTVMEFEVEANENEIEVEVTKGGQEFEIELAADTGVVLEIEAEDEEDDD